MTTTSKKCPLCAEIIPIASNVCEYCDAQFEVSIAGYCTNCHKVCDADEQGCCKVCNNEIIDPRVESRLIEELAQEAISSPKPIVQPVIRKPKRNLLSYGILAVVLIFGIVGAIVRFAASSASPLFGLYATNTPTRTATFPPTITPTVTLIPTLTPTPTPTITPTSLPPYDDFNATILDRKKWVIVLDWSGRVYQSHRVIEDNKLLVSVSDTKPDSSTHIQSRWGFDGDFDIQIDFQIGEGWARPSMGHLDSAILGVIIDNSSYHITQLRRSRKEGSPENVFMAWTDKYSSTNLPHTTDVTSGRYRLIRIGTSIDFLYDTGAGWKNAGTLSAPSGFAQVYFGNASISASHQFTTCFDNFVINSGHPVFR